MNLRKVISSASLAGILASSASYGASHFKIVFIDQYDLNLDGMVSSTEFEQARRARFDLTDENGNGWVDAEEYLLEYENRLDMQLQLDREEQVSQTATRFRSLDDNEDKRISREEYLASGDWSWNRFDSNSDDVIDEDDVDPMAEEITVEEEDRSREQILHDTRRILSLPSTHSMEGTIVQYDRNGDEVLTRSEFDAGRNDNFDRTDTDGNGWLSEDEYTYEFEDRLDQEISSDRKGHVEQTIVRFGVLDSNEDAMMTFEEYQNSGHRSFKRYDTDGDGFVTWEEDEPTEPEFSQQPLDAASGENS